MLVQKRMIRPTLGKGARLIFEAVALIFKCKDFFYLLKDLAVPFPCDSIYVII